MLKFAFILAVTLAAASGNENHVNGNSTSSAPPPNGVNGKLTPQLHTQMRGDIANKTFDDLVREVDTDGDQKISLNESVAYVNAHWDAEETLEDAKLYDLDHDGFISAAEVDAYRAGA